MPTDKADDFVNYHKSIKMFVKIIFQFGGFSPSYLSDLTGDSRGKLLNLILVLLVFSGLSAALLAYTLSTFSQASLPYLPSFFACYLVIFMLDRLILHADSDSRSITYFRGVLCFLLASLTSYSASLYLMKTSAENFRSNDTTILISQTDSLAHERQKPLYDKLMELSNRKNTMRSQITSKRVKLDQEILSGNGVRPSGFGPVATDLYRLYQQDSTMIESQIAELNLESTRIQQRITSDSIRTATEISRIQEQKDNDALAEIDAIHHMVFGTGSPLTTKLFYIILHLLLIGIEMTVLLAKSGYRQAIREYKNLRHQEKAVIDARKSHEIQFNTLESQLAYMRHTAKVKKEELAALNEIKNEEYQASIADLQAQVEQKKSAMKEQHSFLEEYLDMIQDMDTLIKEKANEDIHDDIRPYFIDAALENLPNHIHIFNTTI